ncbi:hypothetical protein [Stieleria marina]|uniref:Uncharacterized protein n=1 Tax=Stieleria marina TaxID=1930275 RepID=A0A517NR80_9BACT|nr:hypothetical protein K239x_15850 [Planctomycetes bacterium K23_9]
MIARELGVQTLINTTLTPANVDQIEAMGDRFGKLDIALWSVFFLIPDCNYLLPAFQGSALCP